MAKEWQWHAALKPARIAVYSTVVTLHLEGQMPLCSSGSGLILLLCTNQPTSFLSVLVASLAVPSFLMWPGVAQACFPYASEGLSCLFYASELYPALVSGGGLIIGVPPSELCGHRD